MHAKAPHIRFEHENVIKVNEHAYKINSVQNATCTDREVDLDIVEGAKRGSVGWRCAHIETARGRARVAETGEVLVRSSGRQGRNGGKERRREGRIGQTQERLNWQAPEATLLENTGVATRKEGKAESRG